MLKNISAPVANRTEDVMVNRVVLVSAAVRTSDMMVMWKVSKVNVKVTLVQALRPCTGLTARRGSRGIALPFHDHGTWRGWGVSVTPRPLFTLGEDPVPLVREAGWAQWQVWTDAENLAPPPAFDPRTVQPVASRYTDWATRPTQSSWRLTETQVVAL